MGKEKEILKKRVIRDIMYVKISDVIRDSLIFPNTLQVNFSPSILRDILLATQVPLIHQPWTFKTSNSRVLLSIGRTMYF